MTSKYLFRIFNSLLCLGLLSFSFIGSNCNDILNALTTDDVIGSWQLTAQTGAQYDVCPQETIQFSANSAVLTCPPPTSTSITRAYTASGGILKYTETGIEYNYSVTTESGATNLNLIGRNVSRNLQYTKIAADSPKSVTAETKDKQNFSNSSDSK
jgi:hypothetical protein